MIASRLLHISSPSRSCSTSTSKVRKLLSSGAFYFGRTTADGSPYDLTTNIQSRYLSGGSVTNTDLRLRNDIGMEFLWNGGLMYPFFQWGVNPDKWVTPIICGFFELCTVYCGAEQARLGIISRVSSRRPGTRFHVRGVDDRGYVANFVETEQFIFLGTSVTSHVQIRGTVPLFWEQPGIQVGSHKIQFSRSLELCVGAFERHFMHIISRYSATAIVNLLGRKEGEALLSRAYQDVHKRSAFKLRINCVDCLDRTNSVQTLVGVQLALPKMLATLDSSLESHRVLTNRFVDALYLMWQQNGDQLSRIYAGTGALGSSRSKLRDVQRSAARTIQHSFFDATKHEAMCTLLMHPNLHGWMGSMSSRYLPGRLLCLPPALLTNIMRCYQDFTMPHKLRIFVGTWNVNGGKHFRSVAHKHELVTDWLLDMHKTVRLDDNWGYRNPSYDDNQLSRPIDVFAIGFEEIVDLTTSNIVAGSKPSANQRDWGQYLQRHLNRDAHEKDPFVLINSVQLVGVCLFVFVRARLATFLKGISTTSVKTGLGGTAGNKGGVAIRFQLGVTSVCFVCSHFAAGQSSVRERNDDFHETCRRLIFPNRLTVLDHDYLFWCGDFNYRINLPASEVKRLAAQSAWLDLLRSDQLTLERQAGNVFPGFQEGPVRFAPTYKYDLFCDDYDTSDKARSPAWTDRVLWRFVRPQFPKMNENGVFVPSCQNVGDQEFCQLVFYNRAELKTSDHKPVAAIFDIDIHMISPDARRKVVLDAMFSYGPIDSCAQLQLCLFEAASQNPVAANDKLMAIFLRNDFMGELKRIGSLKEGTVLLIRFSASNTALLTYANPKQAMVTSKYLDGFVMPWKNSLGLQPVDGGYEVHINSSCVRAPGSAEPLTNGSDTAWFDDMRLLVEMAEREETAIQGPAIPNEVFDALPRGVPNLVNQTDAAISLNSDPQKSESAGDPSDKELSRTAPARPIPPRPAPPPRRPPAPNITDRMDSDLVGVTHPFEGFSTQNMPDSLSSDNLITIPGSNSASPVPSSGSSGLPVTEANDIHAVSSCLDLLSIEEDTSTFAGCSLQRPLSSSNLMKTVSSESCVGRPVQPTLSGQPPPLPPRPLPAPSFVAESLGDDPTQSDVVYSLLSEDPFSLARSDLVTQRPAPFTISDPDAPLIDFLPSIPARVTPVPPAPQSLPQRQKPPGNDKPTMHRTWNT
ncbi:unnamed protein product [Dicrocoelium dendriticum]|nr:unnamed protein product [Dicrocoelium dendriticum]